MTKRGSINFRYDPEHDIIVAVPHWNIETREDVLAWFEQYEHYMRTFNRKMDFVVILDDFTIGPAIGPFWGEYRAKIHQRFTRYNYRVHSSNRVKLYVNTSGARYNVATEEADTLQDAIEGIKAARLRG